MALVHVMLLKTYQTMMPRCHIVKMMLLGEKTSKIVKKKKKNFDQFFIGKIVRNKKEKARIVNVAFFLVKRHSKIVEPAFYILLHSKMVKFAFFDEIQP